MDHPTNGGSGIRATASRAEHSASGRRASGGTVGESRFPIAAADGRAAGSWMDDGQHLDEGAASGGSVARPIRVFVVDDHPVVRTGIRFMLDALQDFELVGEAASGEEALAACSPLRPDVIVMDLKLPGQDGIATIQNVRALLPKPHIVILTSFGDPEFMRDALQAGATSYLLKHASADELADAIRQAHRGLATVSSGLIQALVSSVTSVQREDPKWSRDLSDREMEVLALLVRGLSNKQIAERLVIAPVTVKYHTQRLRMKFGARSRTELVALALQHNAIQPTME